MGGEQTNTQHEPEVVRSLQQIIERAAKNGVSDVHIEPAEKVVLIRYRRGGLLYTANKLPKAVAAPLAKYIKATAKLNVVKSKTPQFGEYKLSIGRRKFNLEVATLPVLDGERITVKINEIMATAPDLVSLGLWGKSLSEIERALTQPRGLILLSGRQANRMTTTLSAIIQLLKASAIKIALINSAGYNDASTTLTPIKPALSPKTDSAKQFELLLRDNVTVLGLNMITDHKIAKMAVEAAHSKHLVLAGITADNAVKGAKLLQQISHSELSAGMLSLLLGQLFVRQLCDHCRQAYEPVGIELSQLTEIFYLSRPLIMKSLHGLERSAAAIFSSAQPLSSSEKSIHKLWRAEPYGCKYCDHTGYNGDIGIFEVCQPSDNLRKQLASNESATNLRKTSIADGMISLQVDALIKALRGLIDMPTLLRICSITA